jgi:hypothetical protein
MEHNLFFQKLWKQKDLSKEKYQKQKIGQKLAENVYQQTLEIKFRKNEKRRINILNNNNKKIPKNRHRGIRGPHRSWAVSELLPAAAQRGAHPHYRSFTRPGHRGARPGRMSRATMVHAYSRTSNYFAKISSIY